MIYNNEIHRAQCINTKEQGTKMATRLKIYLAEKGIQLQDFAKKLGIHRNTMTQICMGREPILSVAMRIVKITRHEIDFFDLLESSDYKEKRRKANVDKLCIARASRSRQKSLKGA